MLKISLRAEGLLDPNKLRAWTNEQKARIHRAVALGMQDGASRIVPKIRRQAASVLKFRRSSTVRTFTAKVHARRKDVLPVVDFYSKIPWMGIHERGGRITGKMLIPLTEEGKRIGPLAFGKVIDGLMSQGNAFFRQVNGRVIVFAKNVPASGKYLSRFRKAYRQRAGIQKGRRLERGIALPIAVLVTRVDIQKRLRLAETTRRNLTLISKGIELRIRNG